MQPSVRSAGSSPGPAIPGPGDLPSPAAADVVPLLRRAAPVQPGVEPGVQPRVQPGVEPCVKLARPGRRCPCRVALAAVSVQLPQPRAGRPGHAVAVHHGVQRHLPQRRPCCREHRPGPRVQDLCDGHSAGAASPLRGAAPNGARMAGALVSGSTHHHFLDDDANAGRRAAPDLDDGNGRVGDRPQLPAPATPCMDHRGATEPGAGAVPGHPTAALLDERRPVPADGGRHPPAGLRRNARPRVATAPRQAGAAVLRLGARAVTLHAAVLCATGRACTGARAGTGRPARGHPRDGPAAAAGHHTGPQGHWLVLRGLLLAGVGRHAAQRAVRHLPGEGLERPALPLLAERADGPWANQRAPAVHRGELPSGCRAAPRSYHAAVPLRAAAHRALRGDRWQAPPHRAASKAASLRSRGRGRSRSRPRAGVGGREGTDVLAHPVDGTPQALCARTAAPGEARRQPAAAAGPGAGGKLAVARACGEAGAAGYPAALPTGVPLHAVRSPRVPLGVPLGAPRAAAA